MTKFTIKRRVDKTLAEDGVPHVVREGDDYFHTFNIIYRDGLAPSWTVEYNNLKKRYRVTTKREPEGLDYNVYAFCHMNVVGWKDVLDGEGNEVQFSPMNAYEFFTVKDDDGEQPNLWLALSCIQFAGDATNFRGETEIEEVEKNSSKSSSGNKASEKAN